MWCEGKSIALEIEEHKSAELNGLLEKSKVKTNIISRYFVPANFNVI